MWESTFIETREFAIIMALLVKGYLANKKPVLVGEFGCCTYQGAEKLGGNGFMIIFGMMEDYLPNLKLPPLIAHMIAVAPQIDGHYIRDEGLQAREISDQLAVLDSWGWKAVLYSLSLLRLPSTAKIQDLILTWPVTVW